MNLTSSVHYNTSRYWRFTFWYSETKVPVMYHGFKNISFAKVDPGVQVWSATLVGAAVVLESAVSGFPENSLITSGQCFCLQ